MNPNPRPRLALLLLLAALVAPNLAWAKTNLTAWVPMYKGVEYATGTNTVGGGGFANLMVVFVLRVDLTDPDVGLFSSPRLANYIQGYRETAGYTVRDFLVTNRLQVAINAAQFNPQEYYLPAGTPMNPAGLSICRGILVSTQDNAADAATIMFTSNNVPRIVHTNWPPVSSAGIYTAVTGPYPLLASGVNLGYRYVGSSETIHQVQPRTALGISQDKRYLFILVIDGRQPGYSVGALDYETAGWLLLVGAWDAVNMDGGGSTTLTVQDSTGAPVTLNKSSAVADSGKQRTVGSHFGLFARPVPAFINDVAAQPDDTAATLSWSTTAPASSQVSYGTTADLPLSTPLQSALVTNHTVLLSGLTPSTTYYFQVLSTAGSTTYASSNLTFLTTNYVTTSNLFDLTHPWSFSTANLDGTPWTSRTYNDSGWTGSGPGLLWVDTRATGPNPNVGPHTTEMPASAANNGFPFITYYFRTHFTLANPTPDTALVVTCYLDDGAAFYLNGAEVYRLRLDDPPAVIDNTTLAIGYACSGDATCTDTFTLTTEAAAHLVPGDNVLAVEAHNYDPRSPDITFGMELAYTQPAPPPAFLDLEFSAGILTLSWSRGGFTLEQADSPAGPWTDVPGPVVQSPYLATPSAAARCFRLRR
jgi:hypothetical protein